MIKDRFLYLWKRNRLLTLKCAFLAIFMAGCAYAIAKYTWLAKEGPKRIETFSLVLELFATVVGGLAFFDLLESAASQKVILHNMSTQGAELPSALKRITEMLEDSVIEEVRIMVDYADYGYYADYDWHFRYHQRLCNLGESIGGKIRILSHSESTAKRELLERFAGFKPGTEQTKRWLAKARMDPRNLSDLASFVERLIANERRCKVELATFGVALKETDDRLPLRFWIIRKLGGSSHAVVALPLRISDEPDSGHGTTRLRGGEVSFVTSDPHVIAGLTKMFDEHWNPLSAPKSASVPESATIGQSR